MNRKWWTLLAVSVATFMLLLDITVVNVALPSIRQDLGASFTDLQWVVDAYALTLAALVLPAGSLADRLGRRRLFAAGLAIFSIASLLSALAPDPTLLSLARALQGVGGAVLFAVSLALVAQEFPAGRQRGTAMGLYGATIGIAVAIGPAGRWGADRRVRLGVDLLPQRPGRSGGAGGHPAEAARQPRPQRKPRRLGGRGDLQRRAIAAGAGAVARER
jgi:MFS family permease